VNPEVEELRPKLKEILYDCAVEIRCTKAALYLFDGASKFELVTEYGFRSGGIRPSADENDPFVDRCGRGRTPFFINGLTIDPRFAERMYEAATDRLLAAPIYMRGKLVGFIDSRDKAAKQLFDQADVAKIQKIADRIAAVFANKNVFGLRFITLSDTDEQAGAISIPATAAAQADLPALGAGTEQKPVQPGRPSAPPEQVRTAPQPALRLPPQAGPAQAPARREDAPSVAALVADARASASRLVGPVVPESIGEQEVAAASGILSKILGINGAIVVSFAAFGHMGGVQQIASKGTLTGETLNYLQSKLSGWLAKRGDPAGSLRTTASTPLGTPMPPIEPSHIDKVFTAPVAAGSLRGLYLTVGFAEAPDRAAHEMLAMLLDDLQVVIDGSMTRAALHRLRLRVAERLVEPEFAKVPELRRHTEAVVARTDQFSRVLGLLPADAETLRLAAIVHDAGMRYLDYATLYRKKGLSDEELALLREHVFVGAAMAEPLLGHEVARAVLCHHERFDGRGYPNELRGEDIPLIARVLHICDAYESMVNPESYQPPDTPAAALALIERGGGTQFDKALARRFVEMMRGAIAAAQA
jgi:HD domain/GAF domain